MNRSPENPMRGVIGIMRRDDRLLLILRSKHVRVPLVWCFPGGEMEPGETQEQTLVREMQEELSVHVEPGELLMKQKKHYGRLILYCWSARIVSGEPTPNPLEVAECVWLTPDEIRSKDDVLPGTTDILDTLGL